MNKGKRKAIPLGSQAGTRLNREMGLKLQIVELDASYQLALERLVERLEPESRTILLRDAGFRTSLNRVDHARFHAEMGLDLGAIHKLPPVSSMLAAIA